MENSKEDPPPDTTSTLNTKADNEEGEEAIPPNVALMVRSGRGIDSELFIVDTEMLRITRVQKFKSSQSRDIRT